MILWRGGRPFKTLSPISRVRTRLNGQARAEEEDTSGESEGTDTDDEIALAEFEDYEDEVDPAKPYQPILQQLDLPLGTSVLQLAFPKLPQLSNPSDATLSPEMLKERLVVAMTCGDSNIRLLTLPLAPPSPKSKLRRSLREDISLCAAGEGSWDEELYEISTSQSPPKGLSIGFASRASLRDEDTDEEVAMSLEDEDEELRRDGYDLLVASHSASLSGLLLVHRIPVSDDGLSFKPNSDILLWQRQPLSAPATTVDLCVPVTTTHLTHPRILAAQSDGPVKIFDCAPGFPSWSFSLSPGLVHNTNGVPQHKRILDARWIHGGKAIIVLTADGEWGIWDLSLPKGSKGISAGFPTKFAYSGAITSRPSSRGKDNEKLDTKSGLAPMTPGTRKVRQDALFRQPSKPATVNHSGGGIAVNLISRSSSIKEDDETLVMWHGENAQLIPSLGANWQNKFKKPSDPFGSAAGGQIKEISEVDFNGEQRIGVTSFPSDDSSSALDSKKLDIMVSGERSITILASPLSEQRKPVSSALALQSTPTPKQSTTSQGTLLAEGQLAIEDLDKMLDNMSNGNRGDTSPTAATKRRRVGFR